MNSEDSNDRRGVGRDQKQSDIVVYTLHAGS